MVSFFEGMDISPPQGPQEKSVLQSPKGPVTHHMQIVLNGCVLCQNAIESIIRILARINIYPEYKSFGFLLRLANEMFDRGFLQRTRAHRHSDVAMEWAIADNLQMMHPWFVCSSAAMIDDFLGWCSCHPQDCFCDENLLWALVQCMHYSLWMYSYSTVCVQNGWAYVISGHRPQWFVCFFGKVYRRILNVAGDSTGFTEKLLENFSSDQINSTFLTFHREINLLQEKNNVCSNE